MLYKILIYDYLFGETTISIKDYRNKYDYHNYENHEYINKIKIEYKVNINSGGGRVLCINSFQLEHFF